MLTGSTYLLAFLWFWKGKDGPLKAPKLERPALAGSRAAGEQAFAGWVPCLLIVRGYCSWGRAERQTPLKGPYIQVTTWRSEVKGAWRKGLTSLEADF